MVPPWRSTIFRQMARPMPVPSYALRPWRRWKGLEDAVEILFVEADPVVLDTNLDPVAVRRSLPSRRSLHFSPGDLDQGPLLPVELQGIAEEVLKELPHLVRARLR